MSMTIFEILIIALVAVFVLVNVYLGITGRIIANEQRKTDNERYKNQVSWDKQVNALSLKCYEFQSENLKLNNEIKEWVKNYNKLTFAYNESQAELERYRNAEAGTKRGRKPKPTETPPAEEKPAENVPKTENEQ